MSLFDGMACGMIAFKKLNIPIRQYSAYEIDKYAVTTAKHNFPEIEEYGDVFEEDFTKYEGVDWLVGGSPCTHWSIAQTKNRETTASGIGWDLFCQYVRALKEAKPKFFIYENNKSMSKEIRTSISETFGFKPICINSALVSAQNRQRLYWVGRRNEDGTYGKVKVEQPEDKGILLKDVLDSAVAWREKAHTIDAGYYRGGNFTSFDKQSGQRLMAAEVVEPINITKDGRSMVAEPIPCCMRYERTDEAKACRKAYELHEAHHGYHELHELQPREDGKSNTLSTVLKDNPICEPICVVQRGRMYAGQPQQYEARTDKKTNTLTSVEKDNRVAEPVTDINQVGAMPRPDGEISTSAGFRVYSVDAKGRYLCANGGGAGAKTGLYALPIDESMIVNEATKSGVAEIQMGDCVDVTQPNSKTRRGRSMSSKCNCLTTSPQYYQYCAKIVYATPCEWDDNGFPTKAVSVADGKTYTAYRVEDGQITIKGKTYPIKLVDGFYIIRKLTVKECMRLQTVPEWYEFPVSNSQAYKMLGNGWTVDVIVHLINSVYKEVLI